MSTGWFLDHRTLESWLHQIESTRISELKIATDGSTYYSEARAVVNCIAKHSYETEEILEYMEKKLLFQMESLWRYEEIIERSNMLAPDKTDRAIALAGEILFLLDCKTEPDFRDIMYPHHASAEWPRRYYNNPDSEEYKSFTEFINRAIQYLDN